MKRKLTLLTVLLVLVLALSACGGGGSSGVYEFMPADADLSSAEGVIVENSPANLGGWLSGEIVKFPLKISKEADYEVSMTYSRPGPRGMTISISNDATSEVLATYLEATADGDGDWSKYVTKTVGTIHLKPEDKTLDLLGLDTSDGEYLINLQKLVLTEVKEGETGAAAIENPTPNVVEDGDLDTYISGIFKEESDDGEWTYDFYSDGTFLLDDSEEYYDYEVADGYVTLDIDGTIYTWEIIDEDTFYTEDGNWVERVDDSVVDDPVETDEPDVEYEISGLFGQDTMDAFAGDSAYFDSGNGIAILTPMGSVAYGGEFTIEGDMITVETEEDTVQFQILDESTIMDVSSLKTFAFVSDNAIPEGEFYQMDDPEVYFYFGEDNTVELTSSDEVMEGTYTVEGPGITVTIEDETALIIMLTEDVMVLDVGDGDMYLLARDYLLE